MTVPNHEEIAQALDEIDKRGPSAAETIAIALLAVKNPQIRAIIDRISASCGNDVVLLPAALMGAFISGMNIGLTSRKQANNELLGALKDAYNVMANSDGFDIDAWTAAVDHAQAAITKAEGKTDG